METKLCKTCNTEKLLTVEFWHKSKSKKDGWEYSCKECVKKEHETITIPIKKNGMKLRKKITANVEKNSKNLKQIYLVPNVMNQDIGF